MIPLILSAALTSLPAGAADLSGVVRSADGGDPVVGVTVFAVDERLAYAYAVTRNGGDWSMTGLPAGRYRLYAQPEDEDPHVARVRPDAWNFCDGEVYDIADGDVLEALDFELPVGGTVSGVVLDHHGAPLEGVTATCIGVDSRVSGLRREAPSDAGGRFLVRGLDGESGGSSYAVELALDGWPDQFVGGVYDDDEADLLPAGPGADADAGEVQLLPGISVSGQVLGDGAPLAYASVHAYATSQVADSLTLDDGSYEIYGLPPGDVLLWAGADDFAWTYYPDADRPGEYLPAPDEGDALADVTLQLPREAALRGRVLGGDQDLSGVTVLAYNDSYTVGIGAQADADGAFEIGGIHGGDYYLYVYAEDEGYLNDFIRGEDGEPRAFSVAPESDSEDYQLALQAAGVLQGTVVDDEGAPIYGAYIYAWSVDIEGEAEAAVTASDGTYRLDGLAGGAWGVEVFYVPYCEGDGGFVRVYWPGLVNPSLAQTLDLEVGELYDPVDFVLPVDSDLDDMGDAWESRYGLDVGRDDSAEDPDGDGYANLEEYYLGTDPTEAADGGGCGRGGCRDGGSSLLLLLPLGARRRRCLGGS